MYQLLISLQILARVLCKRVLPSTVMMFLIQQPLENSHENPHKFARIFVRIFVMLLNRASEAPPAPAPSAPSIHSLEGFSG